MKVPMLQPDERNTVSEKKFRYLRKEEQRATVSERLRMLESAHFEREVDLAQATAIGDQETIAKVLESLESIAKQRTAVEEIIFSLADDTEEEQDAEPSA